MNKTDIILLIFNSILGSILFLLFLIIGLSLDQLI